MSDAVEDVLADIAESVTPDAEERTAMWTAVEELTAATESAIEDRGIDADVLHVGSTARDTWLAGDRDIDLFLQFPNGTDRDTLTDAGLAIGRAVLDDGAANYAEHPYIAGTHDGFDVDIVPCLDVPAASEAETAVDRTPFHNDHVADRLDEELAADIRAAKHLLSNIGSYGSDLKTRGFGGYLLELLVLEFDGLSELLEAVATWQPPVRIDPADHGARSFDDALVMIDPTDPHRNVAAVTSTHQIARLQHYARRFLADPAPEVFSRPRNDPITEAGLSTALEDRGTEVNALVFERPDMLDDQLWPQLRKTHGGIRDELDRLGFDIVRSSILETDDRLALVFECGVAKRPRIERHAGPPVSMAEHAQRFVESYADAEVYGPFIDDDRYVVERERELRTPRSFLTSDRLFEVRIGDQLEPVLESGYEVHRGEELAALLPAFGEALAAYFDPAP